MFIEVDPTPNRMIFVFFIFFALKKKMEFQWYTNNRTNSFCEEGYLHIRPTLTSDLYGETFLWRNTLDIHDDSSANQ